MPIRTYTQTDFIEDVNNKVGSVTGIGLNLEASAVLSFGGGANSNDAFADPLAGHLNFSSFPAIPDNAIITKIRCYLDGFTNADLAGVSVGPICSASASILVWSDYWGLGILSSTLTASFITALGGSGSDSDNGRIEFIKNYIPGINKNQLIVEFSYVGALQFQLSASVSQSDTSTGGGNADAEMFNWTFEVTYTSGPFSWYLQTHTATIGGKPSIVVDDIVAVDDGSEVPANSIFYGTGENFPTEADIPLYNWYDPVSFTILNQPIRPAVGWLLQLVDFIGDSVGDMQLDVALESVLVLMTDPSGIYTLVEGQRHDTLYERFVGVPSINVKIPDPFAKTGFIP